MLRRILTTLFVLLAALFVSLVSVKNVSAHETPNDEPVPRVEAREMTAKDSLCVEGVDSSFNNYNQHSLQIVVLNFIGNEAVPAADAVTRAWQLAVEANEYFNNGMDIHGYGGKLVFSTMPGDCNTPKIYSLDFTANVHPPTDPSYDLTEPIKDLLKANDLWQPNRRYLTIFNLKDESSYFCGLAAVYNDGQKDPLQNTINTTTNLIQIAPWQGTNCNQGRVIVHEFGHSVMDAIKMSMFRIAPGIGVGTFSENEPNPFGHYNVEADVHDPHSAEAVDVMNPGGGTRPTYAFMTGWATPYKEYFGWEYYYPRLIDPARGTYCDPNVVTGGFLHTYYNACDVEGKGSPYLRLWQEKMPDGKPVVICKEELGADDSRFHALKLCLHRETGILWLSAGLRNESVLEQSEAWHTRGQRCVMPLYEEEMEGGFGLTFSEGTLNANHAQGICFSKTPIHGGPSILKAVFTTSINSQFCQTPGKCTMSVEMDITGLMDTVPVLPAENLILSVSAEPEMVEGNMVVITTTVNTPYHYPVHMQVGVGGATQSHKIPYGVSQTTTFVYISDNTSPELDRQVNYTISSIKGVSNPDDKTGIIVVHDNDSTQVSVSTPMTRVVEGGSLPILVHVSKAPAHEIRGIISYSTASQPFVIGAGQQMAEVSIPLSDNGTDDPDTFVTVSLQEVVGDPSDMVLVVPSTVTIPIVDALDTRPNMNISLPGDLVEGTAGTITFTLSAPALHPVVAQIETKGKVTVPGTVSIAPGDTMAYLSIGASQEGGWQGEQAAFIVLKEVQNADYIGGTLTIAVEDSEPRPDMIFLPLVRR